MLGRNDLKIKLCIFFITLLVSSMNIISQASEIITHETRRVPAEWEQQEAIWMQWPGHWEKDYERTFAMMAKIISRYEQLHILYYSDKVYEEAKKAMRDVNVDPENQNIRWHAVPYDSAWMRDNGPVYVLNDGEFRLINISFL